ncbi:hypothetical protein GCM10025857_43910 [Alicyclobacillus contaminans]|nr:hypothetical protein GCM10025857_43910 [Alicyclobacillus contaminans]
MNTAAIYHRPSSEFAYLYEKDVLHLRLRTAKGDVSCVQLIWQDPYLIEKSKRQKPRQWLKDYRLNFLIIGLYHLKHLSIVYLTLLQLQQWTN